MWREHDLRLDASRQSFSTPDARTVFAPPAVQPIPDGVGSATAYLDVLPAELGTQLVVLLRAGAAALGWWDGDELLRHKVFKRYVVRGSGRAQPTHLSSKGKSRYGSRLRLQNARKLLAEVCERQTEWVTELGKPDLAFYACPVRLWADLFRTRPGPPLPSETYRAVGVDFRAPGFDELRRVRRALTRGHAVRPVPPQ